MTTGGGSPLAVRLTARGKTSSGKIYATEKGLLLELDGELITRLSLLVDAGDLNRQLAG